MKGHKAEPPTFYPRPGEDGRVCQWCHRPIVWVDPMVGEGYWRHWSPRRRKP